MDPLWVALAVVGIFAVAGLFGRGLRAGAEGLTPKPGKLPPGNYLSKCSNCKMVNRGRDLQCYACEPSIDYTTTLKNANKCSYVQNIKGTLECTPLVLPLNTYASTCSGCRTTGGVLRCKYCLGARGLPVYGPEITPSKCPHGVENHVGQLRCRLGVGGGTQK